MMTASRASFAALLLICALPAAAQAPPGLTDSERREGAQAHPQILQQFGGAMSGPVATYVRDVGQKIAVQSGGGARAQDYTVTLLNSNVNNAFAIPGGYVYITRQLLALMNDEAELAFVMGHEVAHVAARHGQKRQTRSALSGILAGLAGAVTGSDLIGRGAGLVAGLTTLGYSREQKRQADSLGVRYLTSAGYDPLGSVDSLAALGAQTALEARLKGQGGAEPSKWLSTHPANDERVARIRGEAQALLPRAGARAHNRDAFLNAIDGLAYDDDPAEGVVQGSS
ncbi:MAG: M48 family metalloprotease, partial [Sandarakinorhabdus sp.]